MKKQTYIFLELLNDFKVLIPIIQRDYAHGRDNARAEDVRTMLVKDLWDAVKQSSTEDKSLHLDFVYGKIEKEQNGQRLIPFDGQQRLTTLFLFHRYLYEKKKGNEWHNSAEQELLKKFSYATRPSARDFCKALCERDIVPCIADISDASWFDVSWLDDPTVKSMIRVLKTIHEKAPADKNFDLERLNRITFTLADMGELNMGDMSYISMNATGRPLTAWENLKASLLERYPNIQEKESLDTKWADYFFKKALSENHAAYDLMMLGMIHLHLSNVERVKDKKAPYEIPSFDQIHSIPYTPFASYKSVLDKNASAIIPVFALWNALVDAEAKILEAVTPLWESRLNPLIYPKNDITYADRVTYFAIILFFKYHPKCYNWGLLKSWMRIVNNLVENTSIGHDNLSSHLKLIDDLASHCLKNSTHFTLLWDKLSSFSVDENGPCSKQLKEEIRKARLLDNKVEDIKSIEAAEKDEWCRGKISLLMSAEETDNTQQKLGHNLKRLQDFRRNVESKDDRPQFLKGVFNKMLTQASNTPDLWNQKITFPLNDKNQWKEEINKPWWLEHFWLDWFKNEMIEENSDSHNHQALDTLKQTYIQLFKEYTRLWLYWGEFRIATKPSCRYQNCYYMDAYGELEALCTGEISIGWAQRGKYEIRKKNDNFQITMKDANGNSEDSCIICSECFKKLEGDTFIEKLESLFKQSADTQTGDVTSKLQ